eukprot:TRINITY_DN6329_c0_g1_i1.p1 TRINITY_DN6329_c0_g1~~TRINITY_DN6329_c0_g1_i1.p1  ORF type:complete len:464 (-),score=51.51 TRINITY_DN6329_c0_g1_i1:149-1540(-)
MPFGMLSPFVWLTCLLGSRQVWACSFATSGMVKPNDLINFRSSGEAVTMGVLPDPVTLGKNAFMTNDVLLPNQFTGQSTLLDAVLEFSSKSPAKEDLCYWSFQSLPPPPRSQGPDFWSVSHGEFDQDIEWVQAYGEVAVARLHSRVKPNGSVVGAACSLGWELMQRRCQNGRANSSCVDAVTKASPEKLRWPMAISIFKISQDLRSTIVDWRGNGSMHLPNIYWDMNAGKKPAFPWKYPMPVGGETNPLGMPHGPDWPVSKSAFPWGGAPGHAKVAKVVPCSQISDKFRYSTEMSYCDRVASGAGITDANLAYEEWKGLWSVWPPTVTCADDVATLNTALRKLSPAFPTFQSCSSAKKFLEATVPNFGCSTIFPDVLFKDLCCSVCFGEPIPHVPPPSPSPSPSAYTCSVCTHVYDAEKDGAGKRFEDLPDSWTCPVCGASKAAYRQTGTGVWVHDDAEELLV